MPEEQSERMLSQSEVNRLFTERLQKERRRFEAQLSQEKSARDKAEGLLREREEELRRRDQQLQAAALRRKAEEELQRRQLPAALLSALRLESEEAMHESLSAAESAFRTALESGVRERLRGQSPAAPLPQPHDARKPHLSYQQAAQLYASDKAAYDRQYGGR